MYFSKQKQSVNYQLRNLLKAEMAALSKPLSKENDKDQGYEEMILRLNRIVESLENRVGILQNDKIEMRNNFQAMCLRIDKLELLYQDIKDRISKLEYLSQKTNNNLEMVKRRLSNFQKRFQAKFEEMSQRFDMFEEQMRTRQINFELRIQSKFDTIIDLIGKNKNQSQQFSRERNQMKFFSQVKKSNNSDKQIIEEKKQPRTLKRSDPLRNLKLKSKLLDPNSRQDFNKLMRLVSSVNQKSSDEDN